MVYILTYFVFSKNATQKNYQYYNNFNNVFHPFNQ
jgi:hypothetical protein